MCFTGGLFTHRLHNFVIHSPLEFYNIGVGISPDIDKGLKFMLHILISIGKLEGMNNKIKVTKRIAYGYRDEDYFFTLIRYQ